MSTDISHGDRLRPGIEPFDFITRIREVMDPARDAADAKLLAGLYVDAIDEAWFRGDPIAERAGYTAWREWHLEQSRTSPMERRHDPNEFGVQIGKDPLTGGFYLLAVTYNQDLRAAFATMEETKNTATGTAPTPIPTASPTPTGKSVRPSGTGSSRAGAGLT